MLQSPIGRMASRPMRNIETFSSQQMYLYLSLVERKLTEFYHNIDRRRYLVWLKLLIFIAFSGHLMVSLPSIHKNISGFSFLYCGKRQVLHCGFCPKSVTFCLPRWCPKKKEVPLPTSMTFHPKQEFVFSKKCLCSRFVRSGREVDAPLPEPLNVVCFIKICSRQWR